ncbi:MAG: UvrB/UvrC motif-containing protein [Acidobacteriota bacterium]|nr:UvrB/UvrC motif-containing protein [Acidobacteriota bacterium]
MGELRGQMRDAAANLEFERAGELRDTLKRLRRRGLGLSSSSA